MAIRRHYIETTDVSGSTEAQLALAEELIDQYVGPQPRFLHAQHNGQITAITNSDKTIADTGSNTNLGITNGQYSGAVIEIVSGTAAGVRGWIQSSDKDAKSITLLAALSTLPAVGDYFKIYQLAKFPRQADMYSSPDGLNYYRSIPEQVREACIAQVEFIIAKGAGYFTGDSSDFQSESFLNYSYSRGAGADAANSITKLISPQARTLLRGIMNRKGRMIEGPGYVSKYPV